MKKKIIFLLAVLSITPIARSCDMTLGYPLPAVVDISSSDPLLALKDNYQPVRSTVFVFINLAVMLFLARLLLKKVKSTLWLYSFGDALLLNVFVHWSGFFLCYVDSTKNRIADGVLEAYWAFVGVIATEVPGRVSSGFLSDWLKPDTTRDNIIFRVWFAIATALLTVLFFGLRKLRTRWPSPAPA